MNTITINRVQLLAAKGAIKAAKMLNKQVDEKIIKIANAKHKPDPSLPEDEVQYVLED